MGYFKEKLIEQMGHDLDDPFRFLRAQARKAAKANENANWWKVDTDHASDIVKELRSLEPEFTHDVSA